jgi:hypothetical protein
MSRGINRRPVWRSLRIRPFLPIAVVAFVFSMGTVYGAGATAGMWWLLLLLLATPIRVLLRSLRSAAEGTALPSDPALGGTP